MYTAYFNYIDSIELTFDQVQAMSHSGDCENDVTECMGMPEIAEQLNKINPEKARLELKECGAWDKEELQDHKENLSRILWIAACNISDELVCTDPDTEQYRYCVLEGQTYVFRQVVDNEIIEAEMNIEDYTEADIQAACDAYGYDRKEVDVELILEMLFELQLGL